MTQPAPAAVPLHDDPRDVELARLRAEVALLREQFTTLEWKRVQDRFHAFDAIKDDTCPACGSPVVVEHTHNAVILKPRP